MLKRIILAATAFSMLAAPMAQAQSRHDGPRQGNHYSQPRNPAMQATLPEGARRAEPQRRQADRYQPPRHQAQRPQPPRHDAWRSGPSRHHWAKGQRVPNWQRRPAVRDYHRHGLRAPARGQQWVQVDGGYLLISLATGLILGLAAGR